MSAHDVRSAERPAPDAVLTAIADYARNFTVRSETAYETARYCLMDTLACGFQALKYPACRKLLGPLVPGAVMPGGARIPGTSFELEPAYSGYLHFHTGVDILAGYGTPITAAAGGKVTAVGPAFDFGIRVEVTDSYGFVEIYAHMSAASVAIGQLVQQGDKVGLVGSTGLSIGSHLHLQLEVGGVPTDPMPLAGCTG